MTIDTPTRDLLDLVANDPHPSADYEWNIFATALRAVALPDGTIPPAALREYLRGNVAPKRIGAFTCRAVAEGLIESTGRAVKSTDHKGRNGNKWSTVYRLAAPSVTQE